MSHDIVANMSGRSNVVTRFAPSPTGFMHIGGARTALFAYLWARKNNGKFILRIEDTDQARKVEGAIEHIQATLKWLGLDWDYGPDSPGPFGSCIQSERLDTYRAAAEILIEKGLAYPDPYTKEEVEQFRLQAQFDKRPFLYRNNRPTRTTEWDGTQPLRFRVPEIKKTNWRDVVRGDLSAGEEALDDFVIIKSDGYPTYNLAHIVDDWHMGVTHIMRGDEFISSTPRFLQIYKALEIPVPEFVTLPPILREDRIKKLSKRDGAKDILEYREEGYLVDSLNNFLALTGWNPGTEQELFSREGLLESFDIERIQIHGAVLNERKLDWINRAHLLRMADAKWRDYCLPVLASELRDRGFAGEAEDLVSLLPLARERVSTSHELRLMIREGEFDFFFKDPLLDEAQLPGKNGDMRVSCEHLRWIINTLSQVPADSFTSAENIKKVIWDYANEKGKGNVLWPMRYALTGRERSPDPFTVASLLGRDTTLRRLEAAANLVS